ncbi:MAG: TlpA disulfide reductase family protein [Gammaproteobacteria bacterium]
MTRIVVLVLVALLAGAVGAGIAWYLQGHEHDERTAEIQPAEPPAIAPPFELHDLEGQLRHSTEWADRTVVLNFWATWCAPCRREIPVLVALQEQHDPAELTVLGIAIDEADAVREYVEQIGMTYETLVGQLDAIEVVGAYGNRIGALPYTVIVGPEGTIEWIHAGEVDAEMLDTALTPR